MIHFEINKPWEQLKHLDFNCLVASQFKMHHRFFKMYLFLWRHVDINSVGDTLILTRAIMYLLNKRTELISKCRHRNKYILKNL